MLPTWVGVVIAVSVRRGVSLVDWGRRALKRGRGKR